MSQDLPAIPRLGLDTVQISRVEKLIKDCSEDELSRFFSTQELEDARVAGCRAASLAARFAAKEACCKLFPKEIASGRIEPTDFHVIKDVTGEPLIEASPTARAVMDLHRVARLRTSLTHTGDTATAIVWAEPRDTPMSWAGRFLFTFLPYRRKIVLENMRLVFGETLTEVEIVKLAKAYYGHYATFIKEFLKRPFMSRRRMASWIRVENREAVDRAMAKEKGVIILTGHFGNFEVATVAGIGQFPQYKGLFHFVRRDLKPAFLNTFVTKRFQKAGFGTIGKRGSLDKILQLLQEKNIIVYVLDQHAGKKDGVVVDFFGRPAATFKSVAVLALASGAPVVPASSWRQPDGSHVLRFEEELSVVDPEKVGEGIRQNTQTFNKELERLLLRHPEQWIWMHRRWKISVK